MLTAAGTMGSGGPGHAATGDGGEPAGSSYTLKVVRFTVDPLTGSVDITPLDELF